MALNFFRNLFLTSSASSKRAPTYLYNTLSGKREEFRPIKKDGEIGMYNCGPTVYDFAHIGNLRSYVFADTLKRVFAYNGYKINQVVNITDVGHLTDDADLGEDKIEKGAEREKKTVHEIVHTFTQAFRQDLLSLGIEIESIDFPKASEHVPEQIELIEALEKKGYTYKTSNGIYFDTSKFKEYGKLGNINISGLKEGARIKVNEERRNPTDFALWKFSSNIGGVKRQQEWPSPWGVGFPGWHIECSAMSMEYLGETFDIHTGGIDHIPVHHNNEIAQSEAVTGKPFVNYWMHNAFITIDGKKISKSLGNTIYVKDLEKRGISPLSYRYLLLTANYKTPINFTWEALSGADSALKNLRKHVLELGAKNSEVNVEYKERFLSAINDDLNTAEAVALMWSLLKDEKIIKEDKRATLSDFDRVLGLKLFEYVETSPQSQFIELSSLSENIQTIIKERETARKNKDFTQADLLRTKIEELGYTIEDTASGIKISKK